MPVNFLKQIREDKKISKSMLANATGISAPAILQFERGDYVFAEDRIQRICEFLKVTPKDIFGGHYLSRSSINKKGILLYKMSMQMVLSYYPELINDKRTFDDITDHLYDLMANIKQNEMNEEFSKSDLTLKHNIGKAAKCLLNYPELLDYKSLEKSLKEFRNTLRERKQIVQLPALNNKEQIQEIINQQKELIRNLEMVVNSSNDNEENGDGNLSCG